MTGESSRTPTWQWVAGLAISILLLISAAFLSETRSDIKALGLAKLDKDAYYRDIGDINKKFEDVTSKLDNITNILMKREKRSER